MIGVCSMYGAAGFAGTLAGFIMYAVMMMASPTKIYRTVFQAEGRYENRAMAIVMAPSIIIIWRLDMVLPLYRKMVG